MTPEQEAQVARALAETARHEPVPPIPADVTARLDDVLADLVSDRSARGATVAGQEDPAEVRGAGVDEVAARRLRRHPRRHPSWLTAAAALALIAAAGGAVATDGFGTLSTSDSQTSSAGGSTTVRSPDPDAARDDAGSEAAGPEAAPEAAAPGSAAPESTGGAGTPRLRTSSLAADVQRAILADVTKVQGRPGPRRKALSGPPTGTPCARPSTGPGERVLAVRLDGKPATLLLGVARGGSRSARVYSCDDAGSPVASATVALR